MTGSAGDAAGAAAGGADASAADGADAEASLKRGEAAEAGPAAIPSGPSLAGLHVDSEQQVVLRYDTLKDRAVKVRREPGLVHACAQRTRRCAKGAHARACVPTHLPAGRHPVGVACERREPGPPHRRCLSAVHQGAH